VNTTRSGLDNDTVAAAAADDDDEYIDVYGSSLSERNQNDLESEKLLICWPQPVLSSLLSRNV
jgi:hypothetical protein